MGDKQDGNALTQARAARRDNAGAGGSDTGECGGALVAALRTQGGGAASCHGLDDARDGGHDHDYRVCVLMSVERANVRVDVAA